MTRRKRSRSEARRASGAASANIASPHRAREDERGEGCERARERGARARARSCARVMRGGEVRRERASANVETLREAERDRSRLRGSEGASERVYGNQDFLLQPCPCLRSRPRRVAKAVR